MVLSNFSNPCLPLAYHSFYIFPSLVFTRIPFIFAVMETVFRIICIIWLLSEVILNRSLHSVKTDKQNQDRHSLFLIWITIIIVITTAIIIAPRVHLFMYSNVWVQYTGIALILLGVVLRIAAVVSLGRYFTVDVTIRQGHRLKEDGMYTYIRHPSYAASLLSFIGFGIVLNNWLSLAIIVLAIMYVFIRRMNIEEAVLLRQFGDDYLAYTSRTKRIIPFVY